MQDRVEAERLGGAVALGQLDRLLGQDVPVPGAFLGGLGGQRNAAGFVEIGVEVVGVGAGGVGQAVDPLAAAVGLNGAGPVVVEVDLVGGNHRLEVLKGASRDERGGGALAIPEQVRDVVGGDHREQFAGALGVVRDADLLDGHVGIQLAEQV